MRCDRMHGSASNFALAHRRVGSAQCPQRTAVGRLLSSRCSDESVRELTVPTCHKHGSLAIYAHARARSSTTCAPSCDSRKAAPKIKVRRRPPWGEIQLRDAWSEDAMARHDKDSVGERLHSEYRYHPGESHRQLFKKVMRIFVPTFVTLLLLWQRVATGYWMWQADLQTFLNSARNYDTSPRSRVSYTRKRSDRVPQPPPGALS